MAAWIGGCAKAQPQRLGRNKIYKGSPPFCVQQGSGGTHSFIGTLSAPSSPQIRDTFSYPFSSTTSFDVARK